MSIVIGLSELQQRLDEILARAAAGERFTVRAIGGGVVLGPARDAADDLPVGTRRRHRSARSVADVLAEDRGA